MLFVAAAAALALPAAALSQAVPPRDEPPARAAPGEGHYGPARCQELREACIHKNEVGQRGLGNCKWFRDNCR